MPRLSYFTLPMEWYGSTSSFSTFESVARNRPRASSSSLWNVIPGTTTCRIQTGICFSSRYLANARIFSLSCPVSFLCSSASMCLMSSITRSVTESSRSTFFKRSRSSSDVPPHPGNIMPDVSRQVWIPRSFAPANSSVKKSIWSIGSPPVAVIPPVR